jgi:hypothetical protein
MMSDTQMAVRVLLRCAVPGVPTQDHLPQLGATVVYTVEVVNGKKNITTASNFTLTPPAGTSGLSCKDAANLTVASGQPLPADLPADANITCSFNLNVSGAHQSAGKISGLTVAASFTGGAGLYVAPLTTAEVPVAAGAGVGSPTTSFPLANATAANFIAGKLITG